MVSQLTVAQRFQWFFSVAVSSHEEIADAGEGVFKGCDQDGAACADAVCVNIDPRIQGGGAVGGSAPEECASLNDQAALGNECGVVQTTETG